MEEKEQKKAILTGNAGEDLRSIKRRFDSQPIAKRMKNAFGLLALLSIIIAIVAGYGISSMTGRLKTFNNVNMKIVEESWVARRNLLAAQNSIYQLCLTKDEKLSEKYLAEESQANAAVSGALEELKKLSPDDMAILQETEDKIQDITEVREQVLAYGVNNQQEEATRLLEERFIPLVNEINENLLAIADLAHEESNAFMEQTDDMFIIYMIIFLLVVGLSVVEVVRMSKRTIHGICDPLTEVEDAMTQMSEGNLGFELKYNSPNEIGHMADTIRITARELKKYVNNIDETLQTMADKNFDVSMDLYYKGDFYNIKESITKIVVFLNEITSKIKDTSKDVSKGSDNISRVSQTLSEGAMEQSSTVEELLATIQDVSAQVDSNAVNAGSMSDQSANASRVIDQGNQYMHELVDAMNDITENSNQISNIISVINQISTQTNMLALNASIEAARAGEHGKGFAVVANEIGQLANETNEATKTTTELIRASINAVEKGGKLAKQTAEVLQDVVKAAGEINALADEVSEASKTQSESLAQINTAVEQISEVVQNNSAVAQEASSSSQELAQEAGSLEKLMDEFRLKDVK